MSTAAIIAQPSPSLPAWLAGLGGDLVNAMPVAKMLSESELVPKAFKGKPADILIAGAMGARLGVDLFTALSGIASINGRPSVYGDLMLAVCMNHPAFEDCLETYEGKPYEDTFRALCTVQRKGRQPVVRSFSVIEAKEAGLWKKAGPWTTTPQRMLSMRARAFALRDTFTDALAGFHAVEEMDGAIDVTASSTVHDEPKAGKVRTIKDKVPPAGTEKEADAAKVTSYASNDDKEPVVILGADEPTKEPERVLTNLEKAQAIEPADVTVDLIWKRCLVLVSLKEPKGAGPCLQQVIKENNAKWKIATVSDLGGETDDQRKAYLVELEQRVAAWSTQFAKGVEL